MGLFQRLKEWFNGTSDLKNIYSKLLAIQSFQKTQTNYMFKVTCTKDELEDISSDLTATKRVIANAIENLEAKQESIEKILTLLFDRVAEQEDKIALLEDRATVEDLKQLQLTTTVKSSEN